MTDIYTLGISFDTTGAQKGARDFVSTAQAAAKEMKTTSQRAKELENSFSAIAKQLGFARGQLGQLGKAGLSIFTADILAKTLGFSNLLGAVNAATSLVADSISDLAVALHDKLAPAWKEQAKAQNEWIDRQNKMTEAHKAFIAEMTKDEITLGVPQTSYESFNAAGLNGKRRDEFSEFIRKANESLANTVEEQGGRGALAREEQIKFAYQIDDLLTSLKEAQHYEDYRLAKNKQITEELKKQGEYTRVATPEERNARFTYRYPEVNVGGPGQYIGAAVARGFGQLSAPGIIASANRSGANSYSANLHTGEGGASSLLGAGITALIAKIPEATSSLLRLGIAEAKAAEEAKRLRDMWNQVGDRIAFGFEDAILSGQKLSDVLKQLLMDLERIIVRSAVTQPLGQYLGGLLGNVASGGATPTAPATGKGSIPNEGNSGTHGLAAGGGNTVVIMNIHTPDANSFRASQRHISEDVSRRIRR